MAAIIKCYMLFQDSACKLSYVVRVSGKTDMSITVILTTYICFLLLLLFLTVPVPYVLCL